MSGAQSSELIRQQAAAWYARLQNDAASQDVQREFAAWLATSPQHSQAYAEAEHAWKLLQENAHQPEILALRHEAALRLTRTEHRTRRSLRWLATAATLLAATGLAVFYASDHSLFKAQPDASARTYTTNVGEHLIVQLTDGSHVTLDTRSELRVAFSKSERLVQLLSGQALFEVAKERARPFVVVAGKRRLVAVGTAFDVRVNPEQIKVTMVEGTVRVERTEATEQSPQGVRAATDHRFTNAPRDAVATITAGDQLIVDKQQIDHVYAVDPAQVTGWLHGQVVFNDASLADAVAELNRYSLRQIELGDPQLAELRLSGTFTLSRPEIFVEAITSYFPVSIATQNDQKVVLKSR